MATIKGKLAIVASVLLPFMVADRVLAEDIVDLEQLGANGHLVSEVRYLQLCGLLKHYAPYIGLASIGIGVLIVIITRTRAKAKMKSAIGIFIVGIPVFLFILVYAFCIGYEHIYLV